MEAKTFNSGADPVKPVRRGRMNRAKALAIANEIRLRQVATWESTHGNRRRTDPDKIFEQARLFRQMSDVGIFASLEDLETVVFGRWDLGVPKDVFEMVFSDENPVSGG